MPKANVLPMIADRFLNTPLLIDPSKAAVIYGVLQGRIAPEIEVTMAEIDPDAAAGHPDPEATRFAGSHRRAQGGFSLARRAGGVALIDIEGSLVNRGAWIGASSGLVSYEGIAAQIDAALADDEVHSILLDIDSPGGEATGMFAVAQKVREAAAQKRVVAVVNDVAASAAYGIACGASEIVISPTSFTGSIGVVMVHMDHSGELKKKGVKPTILQKGANKTHGHPFGPLTGEAMTSLNQMMTVLYDRFLETVAEGRGARLDADAARATEAGIFVGQQAIDAGVTDRIGTFDEVLSELQTTAHSGTTTENVTMTDKTPSPKNEGSTITQAQLDAAVVDAKAEGAKAATARVGAILDSAEGKANPKLAAHFAFNTEMDAEAAKAALTAAGPAAAPEAAAPKTPTPEQRSGSEPEMGPDDAAPSAGAAATDHGWGSVIEEHNKAL